MRKSHCIMVVASRIYSVIVVPALLLVVLTPHMLPVHAIIGTLLKASPSPNQNIY